MPVALICKFSSLIVKFSPTMHLIGSPLTFIISSILIVEFSLPITLAIKFIPLIPWSCFILFNYVFMVGQVNSILIIVFNALWILWVFITNLYNGAVEFGFFRLTYWCCFVVLRNRFLFLWHKCLGLVKSWLRFRKIVDFIGSFM